MPRFAIVTWAREAGTLDVGDVVELVEIGAVRWRVRVPKTGHLSRVIADHAVMLPKGIGPDHPGIVYLATQLPDLVDSCAHSLDAHSLGTALLVDMFPGG